LKGLHEIRPVKESSEDELLQRPGITAVDIGPKYIKDKKTDELSIRVYVEKKKDVTKDQMIPKEINGVKTDVIERKYVLHRRLVRLSDIKPMADTGKYTPLKGGISIGPSRSINGYIFVGTLGVPVRDKSTGTPMMLSNWHVMCLNNSWSVGDTIVQPGRVDGGSSPTDNVGTLQRASLGGTVDCAVANITTGTSACQVIDIGDVAGTSTATPGLAVRKRGRTTGLSHGTVDSVDLTVAIDYDDPDVPITGVGKVTLKNQISIKVDEAQSAMFGNHGDSGSVVVNDSRQVVGLYFAGSDDGKFGVANPIQDVLNALDVNLCTNIIKIKETGKEIGKEIFKELVKEHKLEVKEHKDTIKELKDGIKERIDGIKEIKEHKLEWKEHKEIAKEFKEPKEIFEGPGRPPVEQPPEQFAQQQKNIGEERKPAKEPWKEKIEFKEQKNEFKEHKNEFKEHKPEWKEHKLEWKEHKEQKNENKELAKEKEIAKEFKEPKEIFEGPGKFEDTTNPVQPTQPGFSHFIGSQLRPDLSTSALKNEQDSGTSDPVALSQKLKKQAEEAKQAKDSKDLEKMSER